ncbi:MAG TPA: hypothetical protein VKQ29_10735 [Aliidongia sp.]|nr:hypothetical protein [Aliidongia sp.]
MQLHPAGDVDVGAGHIGQVAGGGRLMIDGRADAVLEFLGFGA